MDLVTVVGYLTALYWVRPDMDPAHLIPTTLLLHGVNALFCRLVAAQNGRAKMLWTLAGLFMGIWAVAAIFLLPARKGTARDSLQ